MADDRPLIEQLLDIALYAPIGLMAAVAEQVPSIVGKGRSTIEGRVTVARMIGRMTVTTARRRVEESIKQRTSSNGAHRSDSAGDDAAGHDEEGVEGHGARAPQGADAVSAGLGPRVRPQSRSSNGTGNAPDGDEAVPLVGDLAIEGYDSLSASQVIPRLDGMTAAEIDAVGRYERSTRARRTILGRVAQLQGRPLGDEPTSP